MSVGIKKVQLWNKYYLIIFRRILTFASASVLFSIRANMRADSNRVASTCQHLANNFYNLGLTMIYKNVILWLNWTFQFFKLFHYSLSVTTCWICLSRFWFPVWFWEQTSLLVTDTFIHHSGSFSACMIVRPSLIVFTPSLQLSDRLTCPTNSVPWIECSCAEVSVK